MYLQTSILKQSHRIFGPHSNHAGNGPPGHGLWSEHHPTVYRQGGHPVVNLLLLVGRHSQFPENSVQLCYGPPLGIGINPILSRRIPAGGLHKIKAGGVNPVGNLPKHRTSHHISVINVVGGTGHDNDTRIPRAFGRKITYKGGLVLYPDRKSTRLNSSHVRISYAVFCLKKKNKKIKRRGRRRFKRVCKNGDKRVLILPWYILSNA